MYLYELSFTVVTDHQSLVSLYNNPKCTAPARMKHLKLQDYCFKVVYERGSQNLVDYKSQHPLEGKADDPDDLLYVNVVMDNDLPDAILQHMLQMPQYRIC